MTDYALWEVIVNGDSPPPKRFVDGVEQTYPPTTAEEKLARKNELKERVQMANVEPTESQKILNKMEETINSKGSKGEQEQRTCKEECDSGNNKDKSFGSSSSSSSYSEVSTCSKACLKSYETLKEHYDNLTKDFNKSQLNVGAYKAGLESVEARLDVYKKNEVVFEEDIKILKLDIKLRDNALTELRKKFEKLKRKEIDKFKTGVGFDSQVVDSQVFDSQENDRYKISEGYHAVPPPYTGNFMPPKSDLVLADEEEYVFSESITSEVKTSESKTKSISEPLIEDWISDSEDENETEFKSKHRKPNYEEIDGGFVAFGGDPKRGRITGKGKISTAKLDFEDVYFVKELKFNLFSVSQICDKKNIVLFTDTKCVVLSLDFKLLDENHVFLRVPRKNNMYSVDLKNIVPSG
ncbi:hypothetical protein Tco_0780919, partial [Tanacetum coccineum]